MATTIQSLIQSAAPGATITVPAGTYNVSDLVLPSNIKLLASGSVTLTGNMSAKGPGTVISGFTFSGGKVDISNSSGVTIQDCVFNGGSTSVGFDGARNALITNNEFHKVTGGVLIGWGLDRSTISNNEFYDCYQPMDLLFNNNTSQGRDITIADNYFSGTGRMPLEVGPIDAYTSNLVVKGNWSENMNNVGQQDGYHTDVAFSVVPTNGVNTLIEGNYASGPGTGVGIELAGSGEIAGNYVKDFWYGVIVYNDGFNVHDNALINQSIETVLNYGNGSGSIQSNQTTAAGFSMPQKPGTEVGGDIVAPSAVTAGLLHDTGTSTADKITSDPALSGTAEANAVVQFKVDGATVVKTATADASGKWTFTPTGLADGNHTIVASDANSGGTGSASLTFTLDKQAPAVTAAVASGSTDSNPVLTGTGDPNTSVKFTVDGKAVAGTVTADSSGKWSYTPSNLAAGQHTVVASETDVAGNTGNASTTFTVEAATPPSTPPPTPPSTPPATTTLQSLIESAAPGATVTVPAGTYDVSGLVLPGNVTLQADGSVTLVGNMTVKGPETVVSGFTFSGGKLDIGGSVGVTIQDCVFNGGQSSIALDGARDAQITNNEFHDVTGNVVTGWGLDQSTISGNKFVDCWQPIDLLFANEATQGRNITIAANYFTGTQRKAIEIGPTDANTSNLVVKGNWSENMNNAGPEDGWSTDVPYSIVPTNGMNTLIEGNYAAGTGTGNGIELAGSGEVTGNYVGNFGNGAVVYGAGFNVHHNAFVNESLQAVLNYGKLSGTIQNNQTTATGFPMPQRPDAAPDGGTATPPPASGDGSGGTGNPVIAVDDDFWKTDVNKAMWQNARYLTWNDKGVDGDLKVTAVDSKSAAGASVSFGSDGTVRYNPLPDWQGKDSVGYTVSDADGSTDTGKFYVQVGSGGTTTPPPTSGDGSGGSGNPVTAVDDDLWNTGVNKTMWQNARYLTWNDQSADGGLKVTAVGSKSAAGASVSFDSDGTIRYRPLSDWQGKDWVSYTVSDADGSTDTGKFYVQVGSGGTTVPDSDTAAPPTPPADGSGSPVTAHSDSWNAKSGQALWFNSRYLLQNDKAPDGGLAVKSIASTTAKGGTITWDADTGTTIYRPKAGFIGKDYADYTAVDADGSTDTALIHFDVLLA